MEKFVFDDNGNVIDTYCEHEYDDEGYCTCCGHLKYMSTAYCEAHGVDYECFYPEPILDSDYPTYD